MIWKRCFLKTLFSSVDGETMLSENGDVIKLDTTGRLTTRPWVSKMADRRYHMASISRQFRGLIYWNAHVWSSFWPFALRVQQRFKQIRRCSVDGRKRYENDKCGHKYFCKRSKTAPFSFENGLVWTGFWRAFSNGSDFNDRFRRCTVDESRIRMKKTALFSFENGLVCQQSGP